MTTANGTNGDRKWRLTKEKTLFFLGVAIIVATWISSELFGRPLHYEYLVLGGTLCGISTTLWGDKK
jgi:hypothetical protein